METIFMNAENSKTKELYKFVLSLQQRLNLKNSDKYVLQNLFIYDICKNIRQQYKNNELKMITAAWNDEFKLQESSYSLPDIQGYIDYIEYI